MECAGGIAAVKSIEQDNAIATFVAYNRVERFATGFCEGRPHATASLLHDMAMEMMKYCEVGLRDMKYEGSLLLAAKKFMEAADKIDAVISEVTHAS